MEYSNLYDLISCLEYGTKVHISIVFLNNYGNFKTELPRASVFHSMPFCDFMKSTPDGLSKCVKCRNTALKKTVTEKKAFGGLCVNGIYEYCHPVIQNDNVIAVIFIGNILHGTAADNSEQIRQFSQTFEADFTEERCRQFCCIIENHIKLLIYEYSNIKNGFNPIVANITSFLEESLYDDISVRYIASVFNYNEKYIGKLFKKHKGKTIKEYLTDKKLKKAKELLKASSLTVTEISSQTGFNNVTYFNRLFKKRYDMTPTEYRSCIGIKNALCEK